MGEKNGNLQRNIEVGKRKIQFCSKNMLDADVKEISEIPIRRALNRIGNKRLNPCLKNHVKPIQTALRYFKMINK